MQRLAVLAGRGSRAASGFRALRRARRPRAALAVFRVAPRCLNELDGRVRVLGGGAGDGPPHASAVDDAMARARRVIAMNFMVVVDVEVVSVLRGMRANVVNK